MGWREINRAARKRVHEQFRVRASYMLRKDAVGSAVWVRVWQRPVMLQLPESALPKTAEEDLAIVFDAAEIPRPMVGAYLLVDVTEAYRVMSAEPEYRGTVKAPVVRLPAPLAAELFAVGLPTNF